MFEKAGVPEPEEERMEFCTKLKKYRVSLCAYIDQFNNPEYKKP